MRLYIPGSAKGMKKKTEKMKVKAEGGDAESSEEEGSDEDDGGEEGAAQAFHDAVKEKAEIGQVVGDTICTIGEVLCVTPRGRFGKFLLLSLSHSRTNLTFLVFI